VYERGLTEDEALLEAHRCMACSAGPEFDLDKCARCLTCARVCPTDAIKLTPDPVVDYDACVACGLCASECPAYAIRMVRFPEERIRRVSGRAKALAENHRFAAVFLCSAPRPVPDYHVELGQSVDGLGVVRIYLPCAATLAADELLLPFEYGADAVWVLTCPDGVCPASDAEKRFPNHLARAKKACDELRLPPNALLVRACPTGEEDCVIQELARAGDEGGDEEA
jgi:ferredoxin